MWLIGLNCWGGKIGFFDFCVMLMGFNWMSYNGGDYGVVLFWILGGDE